MTDIKSLVKSWVASKEEFSVDFDLLWQGLGYNQKSDALSTFKSCEFTEALDYTIFKEFSGKRGRPSDRLILTVDCAKSFCMMARTTTGKQVRSYFIECERQLKQVLSQAPIRTMSRTETMEIALQALQERLAQDRYCEDKPGLANIVEFISKPNTLDASKASVESIAFYNFGIELSPGELNSLGRCCAATYRTWHNTEPEKETQEVNGRKTLVCVYGTEMYSTIENWLVNKGYSVAS